MYSQSHKCTDIGRGAGTWQGHQLCLDERANTVAPNGILDSYLYTVLEVAHVCDHDSSERT